MILPAVNPLRFYKPKDNNLLENSSYKDFVKAQGLGNREYKNTFQDKSENIYYEPILSGSYGFENTTGWSLLTGTVGVIDFKLTINGTTDSPTYTTTIDNKIIVKLESTSSCLVTFRSGGVIIHVENKVFSKDEPIIINGVDGTIDISFSGSVSILGIAVAVVGLPYTICAFDRVANLIDLCPKGGVYLITSEADTPFLPTPSGNDEYSDIIRRYIVDASSNYNPSSSLRITFSGSNGLVVFDFDNLPLNIDDRIIGAYQWISTIIVGDGNIILEVAGYELLLIENTSNGTVNQNWAVTPAGQRIDSDNWYQADGQSENFINSETASIEITGVIRAKKQDDFSEYREYTNANGDAFLDATGTAGDTQTNINSFPAFLETGITDDYTSQSLNYGDFNSELVVIKKTAKIRPYLDCCIIEIGEYVSEIFEITTAQDIINRMLTKISYNDKGFNQGMALDIFKPVLYIDMIEELSKGNELDVFIEQERDTNLSNSIGQYRMLTTNKPIPNYLAELLIRIFNFDAIEINGKNFNERTDGANFEKLATYLYSFSIDLRRSNYDYEV